MGKYLIKALDAKYDAEAQQLVLNCFFEDVGEKRIIYFNKSDFVFRGNDNVPDEEMHKTAELFKGKLFYLEIDDDPNRTKIDETSQKAIQPFVDTVRKTMEDVHHGLADNDKQIDRRISEIIRRDREYNKAIQPPSVEEE